MTEPHLKPDYVGVVGGLAQTLANVYRIDMERDATVSPDDTARAVAALDFLANLPVEQRVPAVGMLLVKQGEQWFWAEDEQALYTSKNGPEYADDVPIYAVRLP